MRNRVQRRNGNRCTVYGLYDGQGRLRYIGQTRSTIEKRKKWFYKGIKQSLSRGSNLSPVDRWIHAGNNLGYWPVLTPCGLI